MGLFLSAHNVDVKETAIFRNVRVIKPVKVGFQPYRDYIGSRLEILNVTNGHRSQIYSSRVPFEAPNWTPDGGSLIFNASGNDAATRGRLWKFDLATRTTTLIDTGFSNRLNNDHVLSFDGTQVAISDQATGNKESTIFTLPATGGTPTRITPNTPSYMHGWTPDAKWLVYTGGRKAKSIGPERVRHLQDRRGWQRQGNQPDPLTRSRRRPRGEPRRQVDLLQLHALGADAGLAHAQRLREG